MSRHVSLPRSQPYDVLTEQTINFRNRTKNLRRTTQHPNATKELHTTISNLNRAQLDLASGRRTT